MLSLVIWRKTRPTDSMLTYMSVSDYHRIYPCNTLYVALYYASGHLCLFTYIPVGCEVQLNSDWTLRLLWTPFVL